MRTEKRPLTKAVVQAAIAGDREAIDTVLDYYADDIDALCVRTSRKRNGALVKHIDEDMRKHTVQIRTTVCMAQGNAIGGVVLSRNTAPGMPPSSALL